MGKFLLPLAAPGGGIASRALFLPLPWPGGECRGPPSGAHQGNRDPHPRTCDLNPWSLWEATSGLFPGPRVLEPVGRDGSRTYLLPHRGWCTGPGPPVPFRIEIRDHPDHLSLWFSCVENTQHCATRLENASSEITQHHPHLLTPQFLPSLGNPTLLATPLNWMTPGMENQVNPRASAVWNQNITSSRFTLAVASVLKFLL